MKGKPGSGEIRDADPYRISDVGVGKYVKCYYCKHGRIGMIRFKEFIPIDGTARYVCYACIKPHKNELSVSGNFFALPSDIFSIMTNLEFYYKMKAERLERKLVARSIALGKIRSFIKNNTGEAYK